MEAHVFKAVLPRVKKEDVKMEVEEDAQGPQGERGGDTASRGAAENSSGSSGYRRMPRWTTSGIHGERGSDGDRAQRGDHEAGGEICEISS